MSEAILRTIPVKVLEKYSEVKSLDPLLTRVKKIIKPYIEDVLENPDRVLSIAERLLYNIEYSSIMSMISLVLMRFFEEYPELIREYVESIFKEIETKFSSMGLNLSDALNDIKYHDLWKITMFLKRREDYIINMTRFFIEYFDESIEYTKILIALDLLLTASMETNAKELLEGIARNIVKLAEELDTYTTTFQLLLSPVEEEEIIIVKSYKDLESLLRDWRIEL